MKNIFRGKLMIMEAPAKKGLKGRMVDIKTVLEIGSICYRNGPFLEIISISRQ